MSLIPCLLNIQFHEIYLLVSLTFSIIGLSLLYYQFCVLVGHGLQFKESVVC